MRSVGETLRQARLEQGLDIAELATRLKISPKHLNSIEDNELSKLPALFFYRSFVQQYAQALNVDSTEINRELDLVLGSRPEPPLPGQDGLPVAPRKPPYGSRKQSLGVLIARLAVVVVGCTGVYALLSNWMLVRSAASSAVSRVIDKQPVVARPAPPAPRPPAAPAKSIAAPVPAPAAPEQPSASANHLVLRLTAIEPTWVSVVADGKPVFSGILQPSESRSIDATTAKLTTGNAGGLSVEFNGKSIGAVGDRGQVRVVTFSPDRFEFAETQTPPAPTARAL